MRIKPLPGHERVASADEVSIYLDLLTDEDVQMLDEASDEVGKLVKQALCLAKPIVYQKAYTIGVIPVTLLSVFDILG